jgi:type II secretory pathway component GspD/PulD (secretin)
MTKNISLLTKSTWCSIRFGRKTAAFAACTIFSLLSSQAAQSLEPKWPAGQYRYLVVDQDVRDILTEFGRNLSITVKVSDQVVPRRIRGRLPVSGAKEFLNRLCESYGLVWYFDGAVLHVSAESEVRTELVNIGSFNPSGVNEKLQALGISDARYPIRSTPDARVMSVSGPPAYLALVRDTVSTMQKISRPRNVREVDEGDEVRVRVFRGKAGQGSGS